MVPNTKAFRAEAVMCTLDYASPVEGQVEQMAVTVWDEVDIIICVYTGA